MTPPERTPLAFRLTLPAELEDQVVGILWELGTDGLESLPAEGPLAVLLAYFQESPSVEEVLLDRLAPLGGVLLERTPVRDVDWVARFREGFRGFTCGRFVIAPVWETAPVAGGSWLLRVDPGRAFGTGTHETTRLCLKALEGSAPPPTPTARLLDVGTGSGILAVAACLLGWRRVFAVDIDPDATASARAMGALNSSLLHVVRGDLGAAFLRGAFDVVVANLTAALLVARAEELFALAAPAATFVLSGLLATDLPGVLAAYSPLGRVTTDIEGEWASVVLRVPS